MYLLNRTEYPDHRMDERTPVDDGLMYEPRVWWETVNVTVTDSVPASFAPIQLTPERWYNGSRHTLVFSHALLSPINYVLKEIGEASIPSGGFQNCGASINRWRVQFSAPFRLHLSRTALFTGAYTPGPTQMPGMRYSPTPWGSSIFGVARWTFDRPYWLPQKGIIAIDLSNAPGNFPPGVNPLDAPPVASSVLVTEGWQEGGIFRKNGRLRDTAPHAYPFDQPGNLGWPGGAQPFPAPGGFAANFAAGTSGINDPAGVWRGDAYKRQESNRGTPRNWVDGFSVLIDQIDYDDFIQTSPVPGIAGNAVAQMANQMAVKAKTTNGGTNENWWDPWAPISLVTPSITPAMVHRFDQPITMAPGDGLRVEIIPPPDSLANPQVLAANYSIGVSLCGYAMVEG